MALELPDRRLFVKSTAAVAAGAFASTAAAHSISRGKRKASMTGPTNMLVVDVKQFGAVGDGTTDDTAAIQDAIDSMPVDLGGCCLWFPPGLYRVTDTLQFGAQSGYCIQGSGCLVSANGTWENYYFVGSAIIADSGDFTSKPVVDFYGSQCFTMRDLSIIGNSALSLTNAAAFGVRVRHKTGFGAGNGFFENVSIYWCDQGVNHGNGADSNVTSADSMFVKCNISRCNTGFRSEFGQAVNFSFHQCVMTYVTDCFQMAGSNLLATLFTTADVQRVVVIQGGGSNSGHTTFVNMKCEQVTYRTCIFDVESSADAAAVRATFIDTHIAAGQPSGGARFKLRGNHVCKVIGGCNLCSAGGVLFDLLGGTGNGSILVEGAELPNNSAYVVGTVASGSKYRIRSCFDSGTAQFLTDYGNG